MNVGFATGKPPFAQQSLYLSRSVRRHVNADTVTVFCPENEQGEIPERIWNELTAHHTVIEGPQPISNYPIGAKLQAFVSAQQRGTDSVTVLLDTDTLVVSSLTHMSNIETDIAAAPVLIKSGRYWATKHSRSDWRQLERHFGLTAPNECLTTLVDRRPIRPYFNAGVVITRRKEFPQQWLDWTREIHQLLTNDYQFADQIALGLLSQTMSTHILGRLDNFPVPQTFHHPRTIRVLHYFDLPHLIRVRTPELTDELNAIGLKNVLAPYRNLLIMLTTQYGFKHTVKAAIGRRLKHFRDCLVPSAMTESRLP